MATLQLQIPVTQVIKELREWIKCEWCDSMATGLAETDQEETLPSCGLPNHGYDFQLGVDNSFFQTRNNLLQIAERCYKAEQTLKELTTIANRCEEMNSIIEGTNRPLEGFIELVSTSAYKDKCEELWKAVVDADYEASEVRE